jgi:hypothetical protein
VCSNHTCVAGSARADGTTCSDGSAATRYDVCEAGTCRGYACSSDAHCGDGAACNGSERCLNRACVAGTPMQCDDGNVCNGGETCSGSACVPGTSLQCPLDDGPCFDASCDAELGCHVEMHPDGSACTTSASGLAGQCQAGLCIADAPPPPDEEEPASCDTAYGAPAGAHQVLTAAPESSRKIVWSAPLHPMGAVLEYRVRWTSAWASLRAAPESTRGCNAVWAATLSGLKPGATYEYRVSGASAQGRVFGDTRVIRTGSAPSQRRFKFAFLAGNGLAASPQSPRAANVLAQVDYLAYPLVLGAGGYALSAEAIAAGAAPDTAAALAAWKRQAGVVTANAIFAPVLGGSEVESLMHGERASDYSEFTRSPSGAASPTGSRSFDFNGTHFVALHAPFRAALHPKTTRGAANLAWLDADLSSGRRVGAGRPAPGSGRGAATPRREPGAVGRGHELRALVRAARPARVADHRRRQPARHHLDRRRRVRAHGLGRAHGLRQLVGDPARLERGAQQLARHLPGRDGRRAGHARGRVRHRRERHAHRRRHDRDPLANPVPRAG